MSPLFGFIFLSFFLKKFYKDEMCILPLFSLLSLLKI